MSKLQPLETSPGTSLRLQYIIAGAIVIAIFILGSIAAAIYFNSATEKNTQLLKMHDNIIVHVNEARNAIWIADKSLYVILSNSAQVQLNSIESKFNDVGEKLHNLLLISGINKTGVEPHLIDLLRSYKKLNSEVIELLKLRKDINWLYPMLPFINTTLLESNQEFESALEQALQETLREDEIITKTYEALESIKNIWRLKILDFRGSLIRYIGLNARNISQEKNISNYHSIITSKLKELSMLGIKGELGFESEAAVEVMQESSIRWNDDYQELLNIRKSQPWRSDIFFIRTRIQPLQKEMFDKLGLLEGKLNDWSASNTKHVESIAQRINIELWFLTSISVIFIILIYLRINKSLLTPVAEITESLSINTGSYDGVVLSEGGSKEINVLVKAFNTMRDQINHRQVVLEFQAMHDALTGLPNRVLLQDRLEQAILQAQRNNSTISLLLLDLDRFKEINDTLGHPVGDKVLRIVSSRLEECVRSMDTVARLGGDEFAVITLESDKTKIEKLLNRIIKSIEYVITIEDQKLYVGVSIGIATFPNDGNNGDILIQRADIAMYSAKRENKDIEFYQNNKDYYHADNLTLLADLKIELKKPSGQIQVYFQPQINLLTGRLTGFEALIRWDHPTQGFLPAEKIVRMAEQTGMISDLTCFVLDSSISEFKKWDDDSISVSINLSVWNIQDTNFIDYLKEAISMKSISPKNISFEITESAVMNDPHKAREVLQLLKDMGFELSIDDYGTGFSSLAYLKLLPVKYLKIDKSFVLDMLDDENDAVIVQSTIDLAHNLGLVVVAEGVENQETLLWLKKLGCDSAQGYYISRPIPQLKVAKWIKNFNTSQDGENLFLKP
ncbi:MAG: bifunctional diguanylate cyclase/phosphodiesterase [Woeseiaceae bacterium]